MGEEHSGWGLPFTLRAWSSPAVGGWGGEGWCYPHVAGAGPVGLRWGGGPPPPIQRPGGGSCYRQAQQWLRVQRAPPSLLPPACSSRAPSSSFVLRGSPAPRAGGGAGGGGVSPGWGVSSPPALHERGAGSCPPPGHEPVPAAPGTVAGTPGRLPRPPAHTHPRALARCGPFRLPGPPGAPPPPPPPAREPPPRPLLPGAPPPTPGPPRCSQASPLPAQLGELGSLGRGRGPWGSCGRRRARRQTDRRTDRVRAPPATWRRSSGTMAGSAVPGGNCRQTNLKR